MNMIQTTLDHLSKQHALGRTVHSELDLLDLVEEGLPIGALVALAELGELSDADLGEIVPRRTLQHARKKERLSSDQSDRVIRAIGLIMRAHEVFGSPEKANRWLKGPSRRLGDKTPLSLLRTSSGSEMVEALLDRIAYGVFA